MNGPRRSPQPPLAGLLQPDGTVTLPGPIAFEVLRLLVFALTEQARSTGGQPSPAARQLLTALYTAAERHRRASPAARQGDEDQAAVLGVSVREAATALGCSPQWVRALLAAGRLAGRRSGGVWIVHLNRPLATSQAPQQSA